MKVILSRKGFDSENGGIPSAIMPNGDVVSFPIPSDDDFTYNDLEYNGITYGAILEDLCPEGSFVSCHVDPDLDKSHWRHIPKNWRPAFGQIGSSSKYLTQTVGIKEGDVFLFFGWFHQVEQYILGGFSYASDKKDFYKGNDLHIIWGYLQVGEVISDPARIHREFYWHPHADSRRFDDSNILVVPRKNLSFNHAKPGCGLLPFSEKRVLTAPGRSKAYWRRNPVYEPENLIVRKGRKNSSRDPDCVYYSGIWQELGLKESKTADDWCMSMILG